MAEGDYVVWSRNGIRGIYEARTTSNIVEAGKSMLDPNQGDIPNGRTTYLAASRAGTSKYGSFVMRVHGMLSHNQNNPKYNPIPGQEDTWRSRRIIKEEALEVLAPTMFGRGGNGSADKVSLVFPGDQGKYPNVYIRVVSEAMGWNWDSVESVQFIWEEEQ